MVIECKYNVIDCQDMYLCYLKHHFWHSETVLCRICCSVHVYFIPDMSRDM